MSNEYPKRRLVRVPIDNALMDNIFRSGRIPPTVVDGVPNDAVMIGSTFDAFTNHVNVIYQHDSFAEVEPGTIIPVFIPTLRTAPMNLTSEQVDWLGARLLELGIEGDENSVALGAIVQMVGSGEMTITKNETAQESKNTQWLCSLCYNELCEACWGKVPTRTTVLDPKGVACSLCGHVSGTFLLVDKLHVEYG